ncbi:HlyD family efflux transporter periplasmic adaptor subunit [Chitinophaga sp. SYP-B3965]|uniref:efflux RND transporter periplasmic adaptor subunit n=1 Tax=Chitinophaga sp. SYP-B3965 TaxID=2663120 RepID=UPI0012995AE2|nr:efflux RND transporter periplasmic adaptor subunit [Chitinophaga sp. SYP-B3965]MRG44412.1 HlyD family efflux transporter periplasmic adaptor subunit [Chitinophaga sp. SYP-B3965]
MKLYALLLITLTATYTSCRQNNGEGGEVATFVLSDTMLASISIDTTVIKPVESELRLSGKVTPDELGDGWITANVFEKDISHVQEGTPVEINITSYPDMVFQGEIEKVYNVPDPATKTVQVSISLDNEGVLLKPDMFATVLLRYPESGEMMAIPTSAVIFDKGKSFVMVFRDKYNIDTREVKVNKSLKEVTYISKGLLPGEKVISKNQLQIYDALND